MVNRIVLNETSYHGAGAIQEIQQKQQNVDLKKHLFVLIQSCKIRSYKEGNRCIR